MSRALSGDKSQHDLLRLKTDLEVISNLKYYDTSMRTYFDLIQDNRIIVSDYSKLIQDSIQLGAYAQMTCFECHPENAFKVLLCSTNITRTVFSLLL